MREMNHKFGITVGRTTCYKARSTARKMLQGSLDDHYHLLLSYVAELRKVNENNTFKLLLDTDTPDSQSEVKGQLLSAVGKDGNNQMFAIAWAVVEGENEDSWTWFIELAQKLCQAYLCKLEEAVEEYFLEDCVHKFCMAFISEWPKCETIDNNICECFNSYILPYRGKRIIDMLEDIRSACMQRIRGLLEENRLKSRKCRLKHAGHYQFEVMIFGDGYVVDLRARKCSCRYWALRGIPCPHAIACIHWIKDDPENFVPNCYKRDMY
ncbi:uncharacterized protein LOC144709080 [Wolffia australiana]